jgi:hypothetical protein
LTRLGYDPGRRFRMSNMSAFGPWLTPPGRLGTGPLIEVHWLRAMQAIDVVRAPAYDPELKTAAAQHFRPVIGGLRTRFARRELFRF